MGTKTALTAAKPILKIIGGGKYAAGRSIDVGSDWKKDPRYDRSDKFQGLQVFYPVDPYTMVERKEFRSAINNVYVYRACRIQTTFVAGQGYITHIVPRIEEELTDIEAEQFSQQTIYVPYWGEEVTFDDLKNRIDKINNDMKLSDNVFNGYFTSLEQGRCALALTPLDPDPETGKYKLPEQIRFIRPEFTLRPILNGNTAEMIGLYVVGSRSRMTPSAIDSKRLIYITHGFNNELFSDFYGDAKVARISDIANNLNLVLNQDYERVAEHTWHQPKVWALPIPPQDVGNEEGIVNEFLQGNNENAKGRDIAVAVSASEDERMVTLLNAQTNSGNISGLEIIRTGLIKGIITAFGIPGFMLSEGDIGKLGGNANIEEVDMWFNTEARPETEKLETILEEQLYDGELCILFDIENPDDLPVKIKHKFNKPTLLTLLPTEMINSLDLLVTRQWIDPSAVLQILHLEKYKKETTSQGDIKDPSNLVASGWKSHNGWNNTEISPSWDGTKWNTPWNQVGWNDDWYSTWGDIGWNTGNNWTKEGGWKTAKLGHDGKISRTLKSKKKLNELSKATEMDVRQVGYVT
jgi:hypothetical protein